MFTLGSCSSSQSLDLSLVADKGRFLSSFIILHCFYASIDCSFPQTDCWRFVCPMSKSYNGVIDKKISLVVFLIKALPLTFHHLLSISLSFLWVFAPPHLNTNLKILVSLFLDRKYILRHVLVLTMAFWKWLYSFWWKFNIASIFTLMAVMLWSSLLLLLCSSEQLCFFLLTYGSMSFEVSIKIVGFLKPFLLFMKLIWSL